MKDLSIIIPIHKYDNQVDDLLNNAITSIEKQKDKKEIINLFIILPKEIKNNIEKIGSKNKIDIKYIINENDTSYQNQINLAANKIKTKYFMVLEFDDELSNTYIKNVKEYVKHYPDVDIFLSLIIETNEKNEALKLTNEMVWSQHGIGDFGELGFLNSESLKLFTDFKLSGAVIKTNKFKEIGMYKTKIKLTFMYEFLLRAINNGIKIMTIPKVIYKHFLNRKDSLFEYYINNMSLEEKRFWHETAKKEYLFDTDRDIDITQLIKI